MKPKEAYEKYKKFKVPSLLEIRGTASEYSKTSLVIIILLVVLLLLALQYIPHYQVAQFNITNQKDLADAENSYRATLAQTFGGVAIAIGIYYTWRRITIAEEDLKATKEGQIIERFTRAVDQLGAKDKDEKPVFEVRLGAIYSLEGIANEPPQKHYSQILEILTAYVRMNSRFKEENVNIDDIHDFKKFVNSKTKVNPDIKAIMDVIKRRKFYLGEGESVGLELRETYLRQINLKNAHLEGAFLLHTDLIGAYLEDAHFEGAYLNGAYLNWAYLNNAHFEDVHFDDAHLEKTDFKDVNLEKAHFKGAFLGGAYLGGVKLRGAKNLTAEQLSKVYTLYKAELDSKLEAELRAKGFGHLLDDEP